MTTTVSVFPDVLSEYGPLTTAFTYAPACTDRWIQYPQEGTDRITNSIPLECQPSIKSRLFSGATYSPGSCISGDHMLSILEVRASGYKEGDG
jgi:hypothetical protein